MAQNSFIYLIPLVAAFVLFLAKCYLHEHARTQGSLSFLLAMVSVLLLMSYMGMLVLGVLPAYAAVAYGGVGAVMVGLAAILFRL